MHPPVQVASEYGRTGVRPDRSTLQHLIVMLLSSVPAERLIAGDTLELVTGVDLGYDPSAPLVERLAATERWKSWLDEDPPPAEDGDGI